MNRRLRDEMTLEAPIDVGQMWTTSLTTDELERRVRETVGGDFDTMSLNRVLMPPSQGFLPFVSSRFYFS